MIENDRWGSTTLKEIKMEKLIMSWGGPRQEYRKWDKWAMRWGKKLLTFHFKIELERLVFHPWKQLPHTQFISISEFSQLSKSWQDTTQIHTTANKLGIFLRESSHSKCCKPITTNVTSTTNTHSLQKSIQASQQSIYTYLYRLNVSFTSNLSNLYNI